MFAATTRAASKRMTVRNFSSSSKRLSGHAEEGVYSNLPFKVKNRKIPFAIPFFGTLGFFFGFPFIVTYVQMKKAGSFDN